VVVVDLPQSVILVQAAKRGPTDDDATMRALLE
jgi:hypothetical protein